MREKQREGGCDNRHDRRRGSDDEKPGPFASGHHAVLSLMGKYGRHTYLAPPGPVIWDTYHTPRLAEIPARRVTLLVRARRASLCALAFLNIRSLHRPYAVM